LHYAAGGNLDGIILGYPGPDYISGQLAMKFEMFAADSIRGFRANFARANQAFDDISFNVYADANGMPGAPISNPQLPLMGRRLMAKAPNGTETFVGTDNPVLYQLATPIRLERGVY
jgi:hypothetical protein